MLVCTELSEPFKTYIKDKNAFFKQNFQKFRRKGKDESINPPISSIQTALFLQYLKSIQAQEEG